MKPSRRLRLISFTLCCALLAAPLTSTSVGSAAPGQGVRQSGRGKKVRPEPAQPGAPAAALPDLDGARQLPQPTPQTPPPAPSTARSRRKPLVSRGGRKVGDPMPIPKTTPPIPVPAPTVPSPTPVVQGASGDGGANTLDLGSPNFRAGTKAYALFFTRFLVSPSYDQLQPLFDSGSFFGASFDFFAFSPLQAGGAKVAFASNRDGRVQIYLMNADGSGQAQLTSSGANDDGPRFSPNGAKILFQSDRDDPAGGYNDIYVMNSDGTGQTRLTTAASDDCAPSWSPDGSKIVFQSLRNGVSYQIYSMNADGSNQVNLGGSTSNDRQPSWSPDG
ncbi:MAG TPA: hypothetical protein VEX60_08290, partial [Pyrinomonadaceae bacterium]|nr:hypothetical protein [Pyrinomonadaceae bacterium]